MAWLNLLAAVRQQLYGPVDARLQTILCRLERALSQRLAPGVGLQFVQEIKRALQDCFRCHFESDLVAKALTLKVLNLCLARHQYQSRNTVLLLRPFGLVIDSTNSCHLACPGCVHSRRSKELALFDWSPGMLSEDRIFAVLHQFGPYSIQTLFYNYGEPLLNPNTPRFVRLAKRYLSQTMLSTSMSVPRFDAEAYVCAGLDYMILSIDGASQLVYERFRQKGRLELVLRNVASLVDAKRRLGRRTPVLCWQFLAFEHNIHESAAAMNMARDLGVDEFTLARPFDVSWDDPGIRPANVETRTTQFNEDTEENLSDNWNPFADDLDAQAIESEFEAAWKTGLPTEAPRTSVHTCRWLYKNITMDAHGRIFPCAGAPGRGVDRTYSVLDSTNRRDVYNSEKYRRARLYFADTQAYHRDHAANGGHENPHCVDCEWNEIKADIDEAEIRHYLKSAGGALFNPHVINMLASW